MIFLKKYFTISAVVLSLAFLVGCGTAIPISTQHDALAKHLTESGFKMYGADWCGACKKQKELFGSSFQYINYEECAVPSSSGQTESCQAENIERYPTWEFADGTRKEGVLSIKELTERSEFKPTPLE